MSGELAMIVLSAFLRKGGGSKQIDTNRKGLPSLPKRKMVTPKIGKQWEGRIPGQGNITVGPSNPIRKFLKQ